MKRIIRILLILLGFLLVLPDSNKLSAQSSNPFQLFSAIDSNIVEKNIEVIDIQDSLSSDSQVLTIIEPTVIISQGEQQPVIEENGQNQTNPFELISKVKDGVIAQETDNPNTSSADTSNSVPIVESLFSKEALAKDSSQVDLKNEGSSLGKIAKPPPAKRKNLIVFLITLFCGLLLSVAINSDRNILGKIGKSLRNLNYMKLLQKEEKNGLSGGFVILHIIYIINAAIFLRFICLYFSIPFMNYNLYGILLTLSILLILRHFSLIIISFLRKRLPDAINYSFIITTVNLILGLVLIPINLLIAFGPEFIVNKTIIFGLVIVALSYLLRWFRGFLNSLRIVLGDSFHFLLYLCTCEIVPVMIFIGYVRSLIN